MVPFHLDASDQKFKRNDGETANQLRKAIAVAVSNLVQWFTAQLSRSLPIRTVIPADAQAAANVSVEVICTSQTRKKGLEARTEIEGHFVLWNKNNRLL